MAVGNPYMKPAHLRTARRSCRAERPSEGLNKAYSISSNVMLLIHKNLPLRFRNLKGGKKPFKILFHTTQERSAHSFRLRLHRCALPSEFTDVAIQPVVAGTSCSNDVCETQNKNLHRFSVVFSHLPENVH